MKNCCVIGGGGFIGSHVVKMLAARNRRVVVVGRSPVPSTVFPENVSYIANDYGDRSFLLRVLSEVHEVVHLAY